MADKTLNYHDQATQTWKSPYATQSEVTQLTQTVSNLTDSVDDLEDAFNIHREDAAAWQLLDLVNAWTGDLKFKKDTHNNLHLYVSIGFGVMLHDTVLGTLPNTYRPSNPVFVTCTTLSNSAAFDDNTAVGLHIQTDGQIKFYGTAKTYVRGYAIFKLEV